MKAYTNHNQPPAYTNHNQPPAYTNHNQPPAYTNHNQPPAYTNHNQPPVHGFEMSSPGYSGSGNYEKSKPFYRRFYPMLFLLLGLIITAGVVTFVVTYYYGGSGNAANKKEQLVQAFIEEQKKTYAFLRGTYPEIEAMFEDIGHELLSDDNKSLGEAAIQEAIDKITSILQRLRNMKMIDYDHIFFGITQVISDNTNAGIDEIKRAWENREKGHAANLMRHKRNAVMIQQKGRAVTEKTTRAIRANLNARLSDDVSQELKAQLVQYFFVAESHAYAAIVIVHSVVFVKLIILFLMIQATMQVASMIQTQLTSMLNQ